MRASNLKVETGRGRTMVRPHRDNSQQQTANNKMLNYIWFGMILISVIVGSITGNIDKVTEAAISSAKLAVELAIGLIGVMALWLGMMKIAEESGLIETIGKIVRPIAIWLFPEVPPEHPAMGAIILNMAANILGLGNAATPLGLKAMQELQELNPQKDTATNAMCTFLALNTSSVTLILPATVVGLMGIHSNQIFLSTILATSMSTIAAIIAVKLLEKSKRFALLGDSQIEPQLENQEEKEISNKESSRSK